MRLVRWVALAAMPAALAAQSDSSSWWRDAARKDIAAAREVMNTKFITALNSPGPEWTTLLEAASREVAKDTERVRDAASYQSVLKRFASAFDDAHVRVRFRPARVLPQEWPGFLVRYKAGHFTVVESERADVRVGSPVTGCDAKPIDQVLNEAVPVDTRPGSPANFDLPSGEASISAPNMVREVRQRGDNFAWKPDIYFDGDIADTQAVRAWILGIVLPRS
jgi:hypothetical protein